MSVDSTEVRQVAVMWVDIFYLQVARLEEAVDDFHAAMSADEFRRTFEERGEPEEWSDYLAEIPGGLNQRLVSRLAADKYFLLHAIAQVVKCARRLPEDRLPDFIHADLMTLLRNLEDHWEDPNGKSGKKLRETIPDIAPGRIAWVKDHIWLEGVDLLEILAWVQDVDEKIRAKI